MMHVAIRVLAGVGVLVSSASAGPFADRVIAYDPAPGQFVRDPAFNNPSRALGAPIGGGLFTPNNSSLVSLGGFGGSITLGFDLGVADDPRNAFGVDLIVYGNAFYVGGNPNRRWAECAHVEVSSDADLNGLADDPWYLIPGSNLVGVSARTHATWDNDIADTTHGPMSAVDLPIGVEPTSDGASLVVWQTGAYALPDSIFGSVVLENPIGPNAVSEGVFGYADLTPTSVLGDTDGDNTQDDLSASPEMFYTTPDDPTAVGITHGTGGGDGIDIATAIDPATGTNAGLSEIHFVRITTAVDAQAGIFGELSAEIDALARARPAVVGDFNADGVFGVGDILDFLGAWSSGNIRADTNTDGVFSVGDILDFLGAWSSGV